MIYKVIAFLVFVLPSTVAASWFGGPKDYDECILESMKGVTSDVAARQISKSCRKKFTAKVETTSLPSEAVKKLDGVMSSIGSTYYVKVYNGNSDWAVSSITVGIFEEGKLDKGKLYKATQGYALGPFKTGEYFSFVPVGMPKDWSWSIFSAEGYKE